MGAWRADLQGGFAGKALVSEPGTPACLSWSAEWLYLAGWWGEGKYVGSVPSPPAHSAPAANPSQRFWSRLKGGFEGFVITALDGLGF